MEKNNVIKRYPLVAFFLLTFVISWVFWLFVWIIGKGLILNTYPLFFIGAFGPCISAFAITYLLDGRAGAVRLAKRLVQWRESVKWYAVALFLIPVLALIAIGLSMAMGGRFGNSPWMQWWLPLLLPIALVTGIITGGPLAEEPGWRGFALPRLQARWGPLAGGLILGIIWVCWHIPLFFIPGTSQNGLPFIFWAIYTLALALLMVWVYNRSHGSILIMMLFHASTNITITILPILPSMSGGWNSAYLYIGVVISTLIVVAALNWRDLTAIKPMAIESGKAA